MELLRGGLEQGSLFDCFMRFFGNLLNLSKKEYSIKSQFLDIKFKFQVVHMKIHKFSVHKNVHPQNTRQKA